jgi:hypothetical protein
VAAGAGNGTTASRAAPDRNGLVENWRAPEPGTAVQAPTGLGSEPDPANPSGCRDEVNGIDTPEAPARVR